MKLDKDKEKQDYFRIYTLLYKGAPKMDYLKAYYRVFICNMPQIYKKWKNIPTAKKAFSVVLADMWILITKYHGLSVIYQDVNKFIDEYFTERIHEPHRSIHEYLLELEAIHLISISSYNHLAQIKKIDNKESGWHFLTNKKLPTTKRIGYIVSSQNKLLWQSTTGEQLSIEELFNNHKRIFTKPDDACQGVGCGVLEISSSGAFMLNGKAKSRQELLQHFSKPFIVEEIIQQKDFAAAPHKNSLNTLRIITFKRKDGEIFVERAIFRMGTNGSTTDNWCTGGIAVKVNDNGELDEYGYFHNPDIAPCKKHPDSGLTFKGYKISDYEDAKKLVLKAHSCLRINAVG